jgi:hypothetical protein
VQAAGSRHLAAEAEEAAGTHRPEAEEADTHRVEAEEAGSYQGEVAVDQSMDAFQ